MHERLSYAMKDSIPSRVSWENKIVVFDMRLPYPIRRPRAIDTWLEETPRK